MVSLCKQKPHESSLGPNEASKNGMSAKHSILSRPRRRYAGQECWGATWLIGRNFRIEPRNEIAFTGVKRNVPQDKNNQIGRGTRYMWPLICGQIKLSSHWLVKRREKKEPFDSVFVEIMGVLRRSHHSLVIRSIPYEKCSQVSLYRHIIDSFGTYHVYG